MKILIGYWKYFAKFFYSFFGNITKKLLENYEKRNFNEI